MKRYTAFLLALTLLLSGCTIRGYNNVPSPAAEAPSPAPVSAVPTPEPEPEPTPCPHLHWEEGVCTDCGEVLEERELPPLVRTERIELSEREVKLRYKGTLSLSAEVSPSNADDQSVSWSSSNTDVASVGSSGLVRARSVGDTVITCTANDGGAEGSCTVHVRYTFPQQLIRIFLLGFLWY